MKQKPLPYHITQLAGVCRRYPLEPKILFTPSLQIGYEIANALTASGTSWVNLRYTTLPVFAQQQVEARLLSEGWSRLVRDADLFFLEKALMKGTLQEGYFAGQPVNHGLLKAFQNTLHALRLAGVKSDALRKSRSEKTKALADVFTLYEVFLTESRQFDDAQLFAFALERNGQSPVEPDAVFLILDETMLSGLAADFFSKVTGDRPLFRIGRPPQTYGISLPAQSAGRRLAKTEIPEADAGRVAPGGLIFTRAENADWSSVDTIESLGAENEIRAVLRRIVHREQPLDQVEIAYAAPDPYLSLLFSFTRRYDLKATFAQGIPVHLTRPGQALIRFLEWIRADFDRVGMLRMCQSGLVDFQKTLGNGSRFGPSQAAALLKGAQIRTGIDRYRDWFARIAESREKRGYEQPINEVRNMIGVLEGLFALLPAGSGATVQEWAETGVAFLSRFAPGRSDLDHAAIESLGNRLKEIGNSVDLVAERVVVLDRLIGILGEHKVTAAQPEPGALHIAPLERASYSGRRHIYIVGLDESSFPGGTSEDPILLDYERSELSGEIAVLRQRPTERIWQLVRALGMAAGQVTMTSNRRIIREDREVYPSAVFSLARRFSLEAQGLAAGAAPPPESFVPRCDETLDDTELWMCMRHDPDRLISFLFEKHPGQRAGAEAEAARAADQVSVYDGWLGKTTPEQDLRAMTISASRIQMLAGCPYQYFLRYVLGIRPPEETIDDSSRWLDPLQFGAVTHDLFYRFMKTVKKNGRPVSVDDEALLMSILQELIRDKRTELPPPGETAFRADCRRLEQMARIFFATETEQAADAVPWAFELAFGNPPKGESDEWDEPNPVMLEFASDVSIRIQGKIDRINRCKDGSFEIWDYKTGSMYDYEDSDLLKKGRHIQWALYAFALEDLLEKRGVKGKVSRAGYLFPTDREYGRSRTAGVPARQEIAGILEPLLDLARDGWFVHTPSPKNCAFCDFQRICGNAETSAVRIKRKLGDLSRFDDEESALEKWSKWQLG